MLPVLTTPEAGQEDKKPALLVPNIPGAKQTPPPARNLHAAKLANKAWSQGIAVGIVCELPRTRSRKLDDLCGTSAGWPSIPHSVIFESQHALQRNPVWHPACNPPAAGRLDKPRDHPMH